MLWALLTFRLQPALSAGIFFELLWLDLFPAGTFIPPHGLLALTAPLPRALIGKTAGDSVEVATPRGSKAYEVLEVVYK